MSMRIKPRDVKDSLLVYAAQTDDGQGDFSSLTIKEKHIEFRFDSGSGNSLFKEGLDQYFNLVNRALA